MHLSDRAKVYELFEGLEIDHLVGTKQATLLDLRDRAWTIMKLTDTVAYEEGTGIAFANITSDVIRNDSTRNILVLAEGVEELLVVIFDTMTYVKDVETIKIAMDYYKHRG